MNTTGARDDGRGAGGRPGHIVTCRPEELRALLWASAYFFCLLCAYYILRPLREDMGVAGGVRNLKWLYVGSVTVSFLVHPLYGALVARFARRTFIPLVYRFFILNLLVLFLLLKFGPESWYLGVGRAFFVWLSVFNLFVVSIFWSFMADMFSSDQAKRLFGFIGVGGTMGGVCGSFLTTQLAGVIDPTDLMLAAMVLLEAACWCVHRLNRLGPKTGDARAGSIRDAGRYPIRGSAWEGLLLVVRSPYLLGICLLMLAYTLSSTFLYFAQAAIVDQAFTERADRVGFFAWIDLLTNALTVLVQVFFTGRILSRLGVGVGLAVLPVVTLVGFAALGWSLTGAGIATSLWVLVVFQVLRRAGNFAVSRPAREVLYTVVSRQERYKSKSLVDTAVYRAGDLIGAVGSDALLAVGMGTAVVAFWATPLAALWVLLAFWLGAQQRERALAPPVACGVCGLDASVHAGGRCPGCGAAVGEPPTPDTLSAATRAPEEPRRPGR